MCKVRHFQDLTLNDLQASYRPLCNSEACWYMQNLFKWTRWKNLSPLWILCKYIYTWTPFLMYLHELQHEKTKVNLLRKFIRLSSNSRNEVRTFLDKCWTTNKCWFWLRLNHMNLLCACSRRRWQWLKKTATKARWAREEKWNKWSSVECLASIYLFPNTVSNELYKLTPRIESSGLQSAHQQNLIVC